MGIPRDSILPRIESATIMNNENHLQTEEREEGEIIDEFEDIISSDEELTMKKRIEELEERNLELEKIENISVVYNYVISKKDIANNKDRFDLKNLPVSDISDNDEFYLPSPTKYKAKRRQKKSSKVPSGHSTAAKRIYQYEQNHRRSNFSPSEVISRSRTKNRKRESEKITRSRSRKKAQKAKKKTICERNNSSSEEEFCALNRDKLRLALKRDIKIGNRKNNFMENKFTGNREILTNKQPVVVQHVINLADDSDKEDNRHHMSNDEDEKNDKSGSEDSVSLEEQELRLIALKSAILKKALKRKKRKETEGMKPYSPSEFVELRGTFYSPRHSVESGPMDISPIPSPVCLNGDNYNRPVDMDLVSSNSSSPILVGHGGTWIPIDKIPITKNNYNNQPPIIIHSPIPVNLHSSSSSQENTPQKQKIENKVDDNETMKIKIRSLSPEPSDEEELALRALLLSKMRTPKADKSPNICKSPKVEKEMISANNLELVACETSSQMIIQHDTDTGLDPEALRQVLLLSMKQKPVNETEFVLKEAVRRLKNQSDSNQSICQEMELTSQQQNLFPQDMDYRCLNIGTEVQSHENPTSEIQNLIDSLDNTSLNEELKENIHQSPILDAGNFRNISKNVPDCTINKLESLEPTNMQCVKTERSAQMYQIAGNVPIVATNRRSVVNDKVQKSVNLNLGNRIALKPVPILSSVEIAKQNSASSVNTNACYVTLPIPSVDASNHNSTDHTVIKSTSEEQKQEQQQVINSGTTNRTALKTIDTTPGIVKAINIPKMKTKVIRTRTKVVNKPISQNAQLKRKSVTKLDTSPIKKKLKFELSHLKTKDQLLLRPPSRLITKLDVPTVKKMIIHLGNSDSESDEFLNDSTTTTTTTDTSTSAAAGASSVVAVVVSHEKDYFDNASPMSLQMDSPCLSPHPIVSAIGPNDATNAEIKNNITSAAKKSIVNDIFQARLDEFLKNARSKVEQIKKEMPKFLTIPEIDETADSTKSITPLAVRHLPPSSQLEYRRLVNRMKILEKQKQAKTTTIKPNLEKIKVTIKNDQVMEQKASTELSTAISSVSAAVGDSSSSSVPVVSLATTNTSSSTTSIQRTIVNDATQLPIKSTTTITTTTNVNPQNDSIIRKFVKPTTAIPLKLVQTGTTNKIKVQSNLEKDAVKRLEENLTKPIVISPNSTQLATIDRGQQSNNSKQNVEIENRSEILAKSISIQPKLTQIGGAISNKIQNNLEKDVEMKAIDIIKKSNSIQLDTTAKLQNNLERILEKRIDEEEEEEVLPITKPIVIAPLKLVQTDTNKLQSNLEKDAEKMKSEIKIDIKPKEESGEERISNNKVEANIKQAAVAAAAFTLNSDNLKNTSAKLDSNANVASGSSEDALEIYGSEYKRNSSNLSENISKALELVRTAKTEKLKKLLLQNRLDHLRREMAKLEPELEHQNKILSKIYPQILEHHRNITELKSKCVKLEKSAKAAAKKMKKGRNNNEFQSILASYTNQKCKEFALEIKNLKDLKISQYVNTEEMMTVEEEKGLHNVEVFSSSFTHARDSCSKVDLKNKPDETGIGINESNVDCQDQTDDGSSSVDNMFSVVKSSSGDNQLTEHLAKQDQQLLTETQNSNKNLNVIQKVAATDSVCRIVRDDLLQNACNKEDEINVQIKSNSPVKEIHEIIGETSQTATEVTISSSVPDISVSNLSVKNKTMDSFSTNDVSMMTSVNVLTNSNVISTEEKSHMIHSADSTATSEDAVMVKSENTSKDNNKTCTEIDQQKNLKIENSTGINFVTLEPFKSHNQIIQACQESQVILKDVESETCSEAVGTTNSTHNLVESIDNVIPKEKYCMNDEANFDQCSFIVLDEWTEDSMSTTTTITTTDDNSSCHAIKGSEHYPLLDVKTTSSQSTEISSKTTDDNREEVTKTVDVLSCPVLQLKMIEEISSNDVVKNEETCRATSKIVDYISPLVHLSSETRHFNPNGIICPFQLMGQCDDQQCKYEHLPMDTAQIHSAT